MNQLQVEARPTGANMSIIRIKKPGIRLLPDIFRDEQDVPLQANGFIRREYMINGYAEEKFFATRLVLYYPENLSKFSGLAVVEPAGVSDRRQVWSKIKRWIMRNGHAWIEIDSQAPSALELRKLDRNRYREITFTPTPLLKQLLRQTRSDSNVSKTSLWSKYKMFKQLWWATTMQSPQILVAASYAARSGDLRIKANRVILCGLAETGDVTRRFILHESRLQLPDGTIPFEGFLPFQSDGGPALEDPRSPAIKIIETMGEYDLFSHASLYREQDDRLTYPHRREDSHSYRLYEVPGLPARNATYITRAEITNMAPGAYKAGEWSSFCSSYIYHAIFEAMDKWITTNVAPVPGAVMATTERGDFIQDMHGNTIGGIRTVHSEAPTSKLVDVKMNSRRTWFSGSERPFNKAKMKANYRNIANYRKLATEAIQAQLRVGFLLEDDREILHRDTVENVVF